MQPMIKPESTMARQVARAVMAFQQKTTGHAPKAVTVVLSQDTLVVTLHEALDDATRRIVLEELRDKVFNPKILSISHCKREFDVTRITAQTDRGEVTFQLRTRDDVREAVAEVEPTTGAVVQAFTRSAMVQVFRLAQSVPGDSWSSPEEQQ